MKMIRFFSLLLSLILVFGILASAPFSAEDDYDDYMDYAMVTLSAGNKTESRAFAIGNVFSVYTYIGTDIKSGVMIEDLAGDQYYSDSVLHLNDTVNNGDSVEFYYNAAESVFPALTNVFSSVEEGHISFGGDYYKKLDQFSLLVVISTTYTVVAPGKAEIISDLTSIDSGLQVYSSFDMPTQNSILVPVKSNYNLDFAVYSSVSRKTKLTYEYAPDNEKYEFDSAAARFRIYNRELANGSYRIFVNNVETHHYSKRVETASSGNKTLYLDIPVDSRSAGRITIVFDRLPSGNFSAYMDLLFDDFYISNSESFAFEEEITLECPDHVESDTVDLIGRTFPDTEVKLCLDGKEAATVVSNKKGTYEGSVVLNPLEKNRTYLISAEYTDIDGEVHSVDKKVKYTQDYPEVEEFS